MLRPGNSPEGQRLVPGIGLNARRQAIDAPTITFIALVLLRQEVAVLGFGISHEIVGLR